MRPQHGFLILASALLLVACGEPSSGGPPTASPQAQSGLDEATDEACSIGKGTALLSVPTGAESVAVAEDGSVVTAGYCSGDVFTIQPDGTSRVKATIPYGIDNSSCSLFNDGSLAGTRGVAISDDGGIWVAVFSTASEANGVWHIRPDGSLELAFPMPPEEAPIPNGLAFDSDGDLFITESGIGSIWKASPNGPAELWLQMDLLSPLPPHRQGADGIAFQGEVLYVTNFDRGTVVKVPIEADGLPAQPEILASHLSGPGAIAFDTLGNLFTVTGNATQLIRIPPGGSPETLLGLGSLGIDYPSGIAFSQEGTAYIANINPDQPKSILQLQLCPPDE